MKCCLTLFIRFVLVEATSRIEALGISLSTSKILLYSIQINVATDN